MAKKHGILRTLLSPTGFLTLLGLSGILKNLAGAQAQVRTVNPESILPGASPEVQQHFVNLLNEHGYTDISAISKMEKQRLTASAYGRASLNSDGSFNVKTFNQYTGSSSKPNPNFERAYEKAANTIEENGYDAYIEQARQDRDNLSDHDKSTLIAALEVHPNKDSAAIKKEVRELKRSVSKEVSVTDRAYAVARIFDALGEHAKKTSQSPAESTSPTPNTSKAGYARHLASLIEQEAFKFPLEDIQFEGRSLAVGPLDRFIRNPKAVKDTVYQWAGTHGFKKLKALDVTDPNIPSCQAKTNFDIPDKHLNGGTNPVLLHRLYNIAESMYEATLGNSEDDFIESTMGLYSGDLYIFFELISDVSESLKQEKPVHNNAIILSGLAEALFQGKLEILKTLELESFKNWLHTVKMIDQWGGERFYTTLADAFLKLNDGYKYFELVINAPKVLPLYDRIDGIAKNVGNHAITNENTTIKIAVSQAAYGLTPGDTLRDLLLARYRYDKNADGFLKALYKGNLAYWFITRDMERQSLETNKSYFEWGFIPAFSRVTVLTVGVSLGVYELGQAFLRIAGKITNTLKRAGPKDGANGKGNDKDKSAGETAQQILQDSTIESTENAAKLAVVAYVKRMSAKDVAACFAYNGKILSNIASQHIGNILEENQKQLNHNLPGYSKENKKLAEEFEKKRKSMRELFNRVIGVTFENEMKSRKSSINNHQQAILSAIGKQAKENAATEPLLNYCNNGSLDGDKVSALVDKYYSDFQKTSLLSSSGDNRTLGEVAEQYAYIKFAQKIKGVIKQAVSELFQSQINDLTSDLKNHAKQLVENVDTLSLVNADQVDEENVSATARKLAAVLTSTPSALGPEYVQQHGFEIITELLRETALNQISQQQRAEEQRKLESRSKDQAKSLLVEKIAQMDVVAAAREMPSVNDASYDRKARELFTVALTASETLAAYKHTANEKSALEKEMLPIISEKIKDASGKIIGRAAKQPKSSPPPEQVEDKNPNDEKHEIRGYQPDPEEQAERERRAEENRRRAQRKIEEEQKQKNALAAKVINAKNKSTAVPPATAPGRTLDEYLNSGSGSGSSQTNAPEPSKEQKLSPSKKERICEILKSITETFIDITILGQENTGEGRAALKLSILNLHAQLQTLCTESNSLATKFIDPKHVALLRHIIAHFPNEDIVIDLIKFSQDVAKQNLISLYLENDVEASQIIWQGERYQVRHATPDFGTLSRSRFEHLNKLNRNWMKTNKSETWQKEQFVALFKLVQDSSAFYKKAHGDNALDPQEKRIMQIALKQQLAALGEMAKHASDKTRTQNPVLFGRLKDTSELRNAIAHGEEPKETTLNDVVERITEFKDQLAVAIDLGVEPAPENKKGKAKKAK